MRVLLCDPPHPLANTLFEALRYAGSAAPVPQATGLTRIATLLHQLRFIPFFSFSHETWLSRCSAAHRRILRYLANLQLLRAWKLHYPLETRPQVHPRPWPTSGGTKPRSSPSGTLGPPLLTPLCGPRLAPFASAVTPCRLNIFCWYALSSSPPKLNCLQVALFTLLLKKL